jgi:translation initiation factor IF-2
VLDLKGNDTVRARGTVLEARLERGRGAVVSLLVRRGVMRVGDPVVSGSNCGKIKAMMDHTGRMVKEVHPGMAAEILGFESVPNAGDRFDSPATDVDARSIAENRGLKAKAQAAATASGKVSLDDLFSKIQAGAVKELPLILKADVFGSAEAIRDSLVKLSNDKVKIKVIHTAPGGITESDVLLATASKAIILGFNVRPETKARQVAEAQHVEIKCYNIIYELIDDVKQSMVGLLDKKKVEKFVGRAEVRQPFTVPKIGTIAGSAVIDGKMLRGANVRLLRDSRVIWDGKMSSLRRFKDDAKEVATGYECGIGLENYNDIKPGDIIEAYVIELVTPDMNG